MAIKPFSWRCPHCDHQQTVTDHNYDANFTTLIIGTTVHGVVGLQSSAIRCSNPDCNEVELEAALRGTETSGQGYRPSGDPIETWRLRPTSNARPQPDFIPKAIRDDYKEACLIKDLSPKASATLSRRCLQGMIRDFCGISKPRLIDEINELRKRVDSDAAPKGVEIETMAAIDAVREVGNVGAHMEKEIDLIIDVEPGEAQALIDLIEILFEDWYVARYKRQIKLEKVQNIAAEMKAAKQAD